MGSSAEATPVTGCMSDMDIRFRTQVPGEYSVTMSKTSTLITQLPFSKLYRLMSQTVPSSCHGVIKFLCELRFNGLLHHKNLEEEAEAEESIHRQVVEAVIAATSSISKTSTPIAPQNIEPEPEPEWVLDSGASYSVTSNSRALQGLHRAHTLIVTAANGQLMHSTWCGRAIGRVNLSGIRCFPDASTNLISAGSLVRRGCEIMYNIHGVQIWKGDVLVGRGRLLPNNLWSVDFLDDTHLEEEPAPCTACPSPHCMLID